MVKFGGMDYEKCKNVFVDSIENALTFRAIMVRTINVQ